MSGSIAMRAICFNNRARPAVGRLEIVSSYIVVLDADYHIGMHDTSMYIQFKAHGRIDDMFQR